MRDPSPSGSIATSCKIDKTLLLCFCSLCGKRWSNLYRHSNGNRERLQIGNANIESVQAELLGALFRVTVQAHRGATAAQLHNLHLAPGYAVQTSTQGFT